VAFALLASGLLWVLYLALEPYVRRHWPKTLVSWSRLLAGGVRDPRVGRDLLLGTLLGVSVVLFDRLDDPLRPLLGFPVLPPLVPNTTPLEGAGQMLAVVVTMVHAAMFNAMWIVFGIIVLTLLVRRLWIAAVLMTAFLMLTAAGQLSEAPPAWFTAIFVLGVVATMVFALFRLGLLATTAMYFANFTLSSAVLTLDPSRWFFPRAVFPMLVVALVAAYGFHAARTTPNA
jgi:hypothetical protein